MRRFRLAFSLILLAGVALWAGCQNPALTGAKVYIQQQDWDNAQQQLESAVQQEPRNAEARFLLGRAYGEKGMYEAMVREFETSLEISAKWKTDIENIRQEKWTMAFNRGVQAVKEEDFAKGVLEFRTATVIDAQEPDAFNNLGYAYSNLDSIDRALEAYGRVLELQPDNVSAKIQSGVIFLNREESQKAADLFGDALEVEPENKTALSMRARSLENLARARRAELVAADSGEDSAPAEEEIKSVLDQAIAVYQQAMEAYPQDKDFFYNLGVLYAQQIRDFEKAAPLFQKVTELDPEDIDGWFNLAIAQVALDDLDGAQPSFEQVIEIEPYNSTAWYQLGIIYIKKGMKTEGEEAFKKAEELQGEEE